MDERGSSSAPVYICMDHRVNIMHAYAWNAIHTHT